MSGYKCLKCGKLHSVARINAWGVGGVGAGLGPAPVCDAVVPHPAHAEAKQACKGALLPHAETAVVLATSTEDGQ